MEFKSVCLLFRLIARDSVDCTRRETVASEVRRCVLYSYQCLKTQDAVNRELGNDFARCYG